MEQALRISNYIKSIIKQVQMHKKSWTTKKQRSESELITSFHGPDSPKSYVSETIGLSRFTEEKIRKISQTFKPITLLANAVNSQL